MMDDECDAKRDEMSSSDRTSIKTEPISDTSHQYVKATNEEQTDESKPQTLNADVCINDSTVSVSGYNNLSNSDVLRQDGCSIMMSVKEEVIDIKYSDSVSTTKMEIKQEQEYNTQDYPSHRDNCHFTGLTLDIKPDSATHIVNSNVCSQCDMSFNQTKKLRTHMMTCTGENPQCQTGCQCHNSCNKTGQQE